MKKNEIQTILVTGAAGQLGSELKELAPSFPNFQFLFTGKEQLSIEDPVKLSRYFNSHSIEFCINCAAYTAVDKAEAAKEQAFLINAEAAGRLASACKEHRVQLIHISTDYVFDGAAKLPYKEDAPTNPQNVYGRSKLKGEELVLNNDPSAIIIRTSWLYSSFSNNFVKTMLRLMKEKETLPAGRQGINVVNDQLGSPTYAADLALAVVKIIKSRKASAKPGIYHFCNKGVTSWYEFAQKIKAISGSKCNVNPISTAQYPTAAKRPAYTAMDTAKIQKTFKIEIPGWEESLKKCVDKLKGLHELHEL